MNPIFKAICCGAAVLVATIASGALLTTTSHAQTQPPTVSIAAATPDATIKALQEALNKQGMAVKADGVLNDETRAAVRKYQTQHHLPVTGEPDKATLDKLGVAARQNEAPAGQATQEKADTTGTAPRTMGPQMSQSGMMMPGGMMNCPMMGGQAQTGAQGPMAGGMPSGPMQQGMMNTQMMQGMMQMMQGMMLMMQSQMQQGQRPPAQ